MKIKGLEFPEDLYFDKNHYWLRTGGPLAEVGVDAYTAHMAGEITYVELPSPGQKVERGQPMGSIESGKWVGRIHAPVSGTVAAVNEALEDRPESINDDPYAAWLCRLEPSGLETELAELLSGPELRVFIEAELARLEG